MESYQSHALDGASAVDLVVVLYDGILRFLSAASGAVERGDAEARRTAVKRALDIIIHLQARLRVFRLENDDFAAGFEFLRHIIMS